MNVSDNESHSWINEAKALRLFNCLTKEDLAELVRTGQVAQLSDGSEPVYSVRELQKALEGKL